MPNIIPREAFASETKYFPPYRLNDTNFLKEQAKKLIKWLWNGNINHVLRGEIIPDFKCIVDIVDMVERRRIYYHIFHEKMQMSESKEIALYCYWILKLQPFLLYKNGKHHKKQGNEVNAIITYRLLLNMVRAINKRLPENSMNPILHGFRYHDLSKESIIAMCECLFQEDLKGLIQTP
ncbi:MAG: hypothetical protein FWC26_01940 [Fibromonadales bacterium]|nr:hypothetical protein [Fibromonadales bacterium]